MNAKRVWGFSVLFSLLVLVACGGGHHTTDTTPPVTTPPAVQKASVATTPVAGMHVFAAKRTISFNWSLIPTVHAQVQQTITLSQSWNGACNFSPSNLQQKASVLVYGLGQLSTPNCNMLWFFDSAGEGAAANAGTGQLVVGAGALTNLVAYTSAGTNITTQGGVPVHIWVRRGATVVDTGVFCSISGAGFQKCNSTVVFQAQDGDLVVATATVGPADALIGLNVVFTKA